MSEPAAAAIERNYLDVMRALGEDPPAFEGVLERVTPLLPELQAAHPDRPAAAWAAGIVTLTVEAYHLAHPPVAIAAAAGLPAAAVAAASLDLRRAMGLDFDPAVLDQVLQAVWQKFSTSPTFNPLLRFKDLQEKVLAANGRQDWAAALAAYDEMQKAFPGLPLAFAGRCRSLFNLQRFPEAVAVAEEGEREAASMAGETSAERLEMLGLKAEALAELGRDEEALATWRAALALPGLPAASRAVLSVGAASLLQARGDAVPAYDLVRAALTHDHDNLELLELLAALQAEIGQPDRAIATLERLDTLDPGNPFRDHDRAALLAGEGRTQEAIVALSLSLERAGELLETHRRLMHLYEKCSDQTNAERERELILASTAQDPLDGPVRAELLLTAGRTAEAETVLTQVLEAAPGHAAASFLLAMARAGAGHPDEALDLLRELAARDAAGLVERVERFAPLLGQSRRDELGRQARARADESGDELDEAVAVALG